MKDYEKQVRTLASGLCSGSEAMRTVILDMVNDGIPQAEAEKQIIGILWEVFGCDSFMDYVNDYRELKLRAGEGCGPEPDTTPVKPEPSADETRSIDDVMDEFCKSELNDAKTKK